MKALRWSFKAWVRRRWARRDAAEAAHALFLLAWLALAFFALLACAPRDGPTSKKGHGRLVLTLKNVSGRTPWPEKVPCDVLGTFPVQQSNQYGTWTTYQTRSLAVDVAIEVSQSVTLFLPLPKHLSVVTFPKQSGYGFQHTRRQGDYPGNAITIEVP